ncbi:astacin-like metalloprotease toxin 1 [Caerostris extrusa]|uniref:Metalloendopeptidase n=1 Tax=Caerostris extrusa TaxID=172846 RepID=A0AAV4T906_CAEEX|nr:astacin-like metalloprotease toxin 1 [Caerostris extrusa]
MLREYIFVIYIVSWESPSPGTYGALQVEVTEHVIVICDGDFSVTGSTAAVLGGVLRCRRWQNKLINLTYFQRIINISVLFLLPDLVWDDAVLENPDLFEGDILGVDPKKSPWLHNGKGLASCIFFPVLINAGRKTHGTSGNGQRGDIPRTACFFCDRNIFCYYFQDRNAIVGEEKLWPAGVVPYELDNGLSSTVSLNVLQRAMWKYGNKTCIRFVPRTKEPAYLHIFPGQGCYSYVGRKKAEGAQPLSLGKGCNHMGTMLHELGHAVGFYHEHSRSDRDDWITIHWENIKEGTESQFFKLKPERNQLLTPFDYNSIMLYGSYTFSKEKQKFITMVAKDGRLLNSTRQKTNLAKNDAVRIKKLYKCKGKQVAS